MVLYGKTMNTEEVFDAVRKDKMFYATTGGGVTVSGGEPLLQANFVKSLFELCKNDGFNTCLETSGFVPSEAFLSVLPLTDYLLFDLKHMNSDIHLENTGQRNEQILENAKLAAKSGVDVLFRIPLITSVNDTDVNINETATFVKSLMAQPEVQLMPYHRLGDSKYQALGIKSIYDTIPTLKQKELGTVKQAFIDEGIQCSISK